VDRGGSRKLRRRSKGDAVSKVPGAITLKLKPLELCVEMGSSIRGGVGVGP